MAEIAPDALPALAGSGAQQEGAAPEADAGRNEEQLNDEGGPTGLVETERDRLIRLVGHWLPLLELGARGMCMLMCIGHCSATQCLIGGGCV